MSAKPQAPAVHIKRKHQSAPAPHPIDKDIMKAAVEIDTGQWSPPADSAGADLSKMGLALFQGDIDPSRVNKPYLDDFQQTNLLNQIGQHPRVLEAMERLKLEIDDEKDDERLMELTYEMHELQEATSEKNRWEGQQRWEGRDNEEMRRGEILSPAMFYDRLTAVIGPGRIHRGNYVETNRTEHAGRVALTVRNPLWRGEKPGELPQAQAATLRKEAEEEMRQVKSLRALGRDQEADKLLRKVQDKQIASGSLLMESAAKTAEAPKEFIRVATLQYPASTEWMIMGFDEFGVPTEPRFLGWRTALLTLIRRRIITEAEAHEAFPVGSGPAASWYLEQLQIFRNTGMGMVN